MPSPVCLTQRCGFRDVGEQDGPNSGIARMGSATRQDGRSRFVRLDIAKKSVCELGLNLNNLAGDQTVRFTVARVCRFSIWRLDQTEDFSAVLVNPIFQIVNTVFFLRFKIGHVRFCDVFGANLPQFVNVHIQRHSEEFTAI